MQQTTHQIISAFKPISLLEMDNVKLLNRMDYKFYFRSEKLDEILSQMLPHYCLLEVNGINFQRYLSYYLDTDQFLLYTNHHNGIQNRYKIRFRNYLDSQLSYIEIKYKNNKGRTIKQRMKTMNMQMDDVTETFLTDKSPYTSRQLYKKLTVYYSRLTFAGISTYERVTLDLLLSFKSDTAVIDYHNLAIAEVKQDKSNLNSPFIRLMRQQRIHEGGISKYCLGVAMLYSQVKTNLFKDKIQQIQKLIT